MCHAQFFNPCSSAVKPFNPTVAPAQKTAQFTTAGFVKTPVTQYNIRGLRQASEFQCRSRANRCGANVFVECKGAKMIERLVHCAP